MSKRLPQILSRQEVLRLVEACPDSFIGRRNKAGLWLLYRTGLRVSELCNLTLDDVDLRDCLVRVRQGKGGKDGTVPFDLETRDMLRNWIELRTTYPFKYDSVWLLVTRDGKQTCPRTWQLLLRELSEKTGVYLTDGVIKKPVHPHVLRHTFATELLEEGFNIREVQRVLRHSRLETTMIYTEVRLPQLREKFARREPVLCYQS